MTSRISTLDRRQLVLSGSASVALLALLGVPSIGAAQEAQTVENGWEEALAAVTDGKEVVSGELISVELPEIAENGNQVKMSFEIDSPMTDTEHVKAVYVFADGNPEPDVAQFNFTPAMGACGATTRMRLSKTQNVTVLAAMSDGSFAKADTAVKVTIGGCGG